LPEQYLITPEDLETPALLKGIQKAIAGGIKLIQLRAPNGTTPSIAIWRWTRSGCAPARRN
jgi:8-oxo-dGTP diphosphatase